MKKMMMTLVAMMMIAISAKAMSFEQARNEALFLTDKMAYELNLTDEQYEAAYEINLDYLMGVTGRTDVFGTYWERRNLDLSYIMLDWQWNAFLAASYFYRPLYWDAGYWHFGIYARYPHRDYFYFGRPHFYVTYRGGHAWHLHSGRGYYYGHRSHFRTPAGRSHFGMHDRWTRGDFRGGQRSSTRISGRSYNRGSIGSNRDMGSNRGSIGNRMSNRQLEGHRAYDRSSMSTGRSSMGSDRSSMGSDRSSMGSDRSSMGSDRSSRPTRSIGGSSTMGSTRSSASFGGSRSSASFGGSRSSSSFGGGSRGGSFGGGSHSSGSFGGGSHGGGHSGDGHTGSRR